MSVLYNVYKQSRDLLTPNEQPHVVDIAQCLASVTLMHQDAFVKAALGHGEPPGMGK